MPTDLPAETPAAKRSSHTDDGVRHLDTYSVRGTVGYYDVPSYFAKRGRSIADAAKSLGLRPLERREDIARDDVAAEIHEQGAGMSFRCVRA